MADYTNCSKCGATMKEGFILDRTYGANTQQAWIEGTPEASFWSGLKTSNRAIYNVRTMRCVDCGFLEFYADAQVDASGSLSKLFGG